MRAYFNQVRQSDAPFFVLWRHRHILLTCASKIPTIFQDFKTFKTTTSISLDSISKPNDILPIKQSSSSPANDHSRVISTCLLTTIPWPLENLRCLVSVSKIRFWLSLSLSRLALLSLPCICVSRIPSSPLPMTVPSS